MTESLRCSSSRLSEATLKKIKQGKLNVNNGYPNTSRLIDSLDIEIKPQPQREKSSFAFAFSYSDNFDFDDFERNRGILHDCQDDDTYLINIEEEIEEKKYGKGTPITEDKKPYHYQHFVAGGLGSAISRTFTAPLDRLKILYQVNYTGKGLRPPSMITGLSQVYRQDGFKGLFRGNLMSLLKSTPDTAIKLYIFEKCKSRLKSVYGEKLSSSHLFIAGAVAGVTANFTIFPLDVIKTRLSAAPSGTYSGIFDTAVKLYKEGGVGIFYKGVEASMCCVIPNSGLNLLFYELFKRALSGSYSSNNAASLSTPLLMLIGGLSSMFSSTLLYPFQTIQSRIIMQGLPKSSDYKYLRYNSPYYYNGHELVFQKRQSMIQIIKSTLAIEGVAGFFKGYGPGISKIILGNALGFGLYERIKTIFSNI
jgi:solute carrier family 25 phosphate transporter 23/24/25/41